MNCYVYEHIRRDTGAVFYVGKGSDRRAHSFRKDRNIHYRSIVAKTGVPFVSILGNGLSEHGAFAFEVERIAYHRSIGTELCNLTDGGDGITHTPAIREKIKAARVNQVFSAATRERMSRASIGRPKSPEHCANISAGRNGITVPLDVRERIASKLRGRKLLPSTVAKMIASRTGRKRGPYRKKDTVT